jgi:acetyltransferase-like isoleucine patch superfamily enzyme
MKNSEAIKDRLTKVVKSNRLLYNMIMVMLKRRPLLNGIEKDVSGRRNAFQQAGTAIFVNSKVHIVGNNNNVRIEDFCSFNNVTFFIRGDNNRIKISKGVKFKFGGSLHIEDNDCLISIGENSTFEDTHIAVTEPGSQITIGEDCMFAYDVDLRTGDSHSIIDTKTNRRTNYAKNISVGDHVWIAPHCSILKGVTIGKNCIVATRSVLTKTFDREGVILGGNPCRILKENITWDRRRIYSCDK